MLPLIENAFKHGASETDGVPWVDIHLTLADRQLRLIVRNPGTDSPIRENIGLSNLRRQLELYYHEFDLSVGHDQGQFNATLNINLKSHV